MRRPLISVPREIGSSLLILETGLKYRDKSKAKREIISLIKKKLKCGPLYFFEDHSLLPQDTDTTSWALNTLIEIGEIDSKLTNRQLEQILNNTNFKGLVQIYFSPEAYGKKNQVDLVALANVLHLGYLTGREKETKEIEKYLSERLINGDYRLGSRYYHSPLAFLYFVSKLMKFPELKPLLEKKFKEELMTFKYDLSPLELAMKITSAERIGINCSKEKEDLLKLQQKNGSWPTDTLYHYGGKNGYFGSAAIATAFALEALR